MTHPLDDDVLLYETRHPPRPVKVDSHTELVDQVTGDWPDGAALGPEPGTPPAAGQQ